MNALAIEVAIIERLRAQIQDIEVGSVATIAGAMNITKHLPLIVVTPGESDVGDTRQGRASVESQLWIVTLFHEAVPDKRLKEAIFQDAGEALGRIYTALRGFKPEAAATPLEYSGRGDSHIDVGWAAFPLAFRCNVILR